MSDVYDYELVYHNRDLVSTTKFSAMIELQDLKDHLRTFLISAGWSAEQLTFLEDPEEMQEHFNSATEERECELQKTIDKLEQELQRYKDTIDELKGNSDET